MAKHMKGCPGECNKEFCKCWCHKKALQKEQKADLYKSRIAISDRTCHNCGSSTSCKKIMVVDKSPSTYKEVEVYYCTAWSPKKEVKEVEDEAKEPKI